MDRIWQWAWDRYGARYSWVMWGIGVPLAFPFYLLWSFLIVSVEGTDNYVEMAAVSVVAVAGMLYMVVLPRIGPIRLVEQWAAGHKVDRTRALGATYAWARMGAIRVVVFNAAWIAVLSGVVGSIAGGSGARLAQYVVLGAVVGTALGWTGAHATVEATVRPARPRSPVIRGSAMQSTSPPASSSSPRQPVTRSFSRSSASTR